MQLERRIGAFSALGAKIEKLSESDLELLARDARSHNSWFTEASVNSALQGICNFLKEEKLLQWLSEYDLPWRSKTIGIIMAGNIPLVGFHDFLSVLISGHKVQIKVSSQDPFLIKELTRWLIEIEPLFSDRIDFKEQLSNFDAIIATGSNNSARYFDQYFSKYPNIIRKNRTSCGIINGEENDQDYYDLGNDIFKYYGLGCRNTSKLFVPKGYNFQKLLDGLQGYQSVSNHHKYVNNYDYNKSIYLVNSVNHLDTGYLLLKEDEALVSPISVLFYEFYDSKESLIKKITSSKGQLQCIVSKDAWFDSSIDFGSSQQPELWDYADGANTISFLQGL